MTADWDPRLITRGEAADLAGELAVCWDLIPGDGTGRLILRCLDHAEPQSCGQWTAARPTSLDEMISAVLRHLVMAHDLPLNRAAREERRKHGRRNAGDHGEQPGAAAGQEGGGGVPRAPGPGPGHHHADRPGHETGDPGRSHEAAGGDPQ